VQRGFLRAPVVEALDRLQREGWLNDLSAARSLVRARTGRYGRARIIRELGARGFSEEMIEAVLSEADPAGEEKSLERAFGKLWAAHAALPASKRRQRIWNGLRRRGFAPGDISEIMKGFGSSDEVNGSS
jgi:SOS response regulatory protein OraA/RecX